MPITTAACAPEFILHYLPITLSCCLTVSSPHDRAVLYKEWGMGAEQSLPLLMRMGAGEEAPPLPLRIDNDAD